jgi:hypothetical protein
LQKISFGAEMSKIRTKAAAADPLKMASFWLIPIVDSPTIPYDLESSQP